MIYDAFKKLINSLRFKKFIVVEFEQLHEQKTPINSEQYYHIYDQFINLKNFTKDEQMQAFNKIHNSVSKVYEKLKPMIKLFERHNFKVSLCLLDESIYDFILNKPHDIDHLQMSLEINETKYSTNVTLDEIENFTDFSQEQKSVLFKSFEICKKRYEKKTSEWNFYDHDSDEYEKKSSIKQSFLHACMNSQDTEDIFLYQYGHTIDVDSDFPIRLICSETTNSRHNFHSSINFLKNGHMISSVKEALKQTYLSPLFVADIYHKQISVDLTHRKYELETLATVCFKRMKQFPSHKKYVYFSNPHGTYFDKDDYEEQAQTMEKFNKLLSFENLRFKVDSSIEVINKHRKRNKL